MSEVRVPIFRDRVVINVDEAADAAERPAWRDWRLVQWDPAVNAEVLRLMRERRCLYCDSEMSEIVDVGSTSGRVVLCGTCGYWGGRGTRADMGPTDLRGVLGLVHHIDLDSEELTIGELLGHLRAAPDRLLNLSPFRAERFVVDLLREALQCEVRPMGGRQDGGVDGYIVAGDKLKTLIQVKWHRETGRAEAIGLIREIAGTMLARGVPRGLLVTTRERISRKASDEIEAIAARDVVGIGPLRLDVRTYNDIIDMLGLAWTNLGGDFAAVTPWLSSSDTRFEVFG